MEKYSFINKKYEKAEEEANIERQCVVAHTPPLREFTIGYYC